MRRRQNCTIDFGTNQDTGIEDDDRTKAYDTRKQRLTQYRHINMPSYQ